MCKKTIIIYKKNFGLGSRKIFNQFWSQVSGLNFFSSLLKIVISYIQLNVLAMVQLNVYVRPKCDAYVSAVLLKQWLRQLPSPIVPNEFYQKCLNAVGIPEQCGEIVNKLPAINKLVIATLISLLQRLCDEEVVKETKMDAANLAMVLAPNILRCESTDPAVIFADSRKQMEFVKNLIVHYNCNFLY